MDRIQWRNSGQIARSSKPECCGLLVGFRFEWSLVLLKFGSSRSGLKSGKCRVK